MVRVYSHTTYQTRLRVLTYNYVETIQMRSGLPWINPTLVKALKSTTIGRE